MALRIGPLEIDPPVVLAPMAGVTNASFRRLCRLYGAGLYITEMVSARALVESNVKTMRMVAFPDDEPIRSVQLYGVDPAVVSVAVKRLVNEIGAHHIDFNFGCPAAKVTRKGGGAALPARGVLFRSIVAAAVDAADDIPVTVKMRIGVSDDVVTAFDAGAAAADAGAAAVALHARTAEQLYSGAADWSAISRLRDVVPPSIPVLGNGDIWEADDALRMMTTTGCDGVVIGRGCLGRPWLFRDLDDRFAGRTLQTPPTLGAVGEMMRTHIRLLVDELGEHTGPRDFRKHTGWYLTGFPLGGEARKQFSQVSSIAEVDALVDELDPSLEFPETARRTKRGHSSGPRPVALPAGWLDDPDDPTPPDGADNGGPAVSGG